MSEESRRTFSLTIHPWCMSPARDEAVRASEDGRSGPLPTLEEAISGVTERRPVDARGGGNVTGGLRTERVTLEVTHDVAGYPLADWNWREILWCAAYHREVCESVRVVDHGNDWKAACESARIASATIADIADERDAAIRERDTLRAERITQALTADRFAAAVQEADRLRARVAELEAAPAASGAADEEDSDIGYALRLFVDGRRVLSHELDRQQAGAFLIAAEHLAKYLRTEYQPPVEEAAPAASVVPSVVREMTDIIRGNATDDEKHSALATLVEAVCPGWRLAPAASNSSAILTSSPAASGAAGTEPWQKAVLHEAVCIIVDGGDWGRGNNMDHGKLGAAVIWADKEIDRLSRELKECAKQLAAYELEKRSASMRGCKCSAAPAAPGWLTEEERRVLKRVSEHLFETSQLHFTDIVTLDALLARSTPPEVVHPECFFDEFSGCSAVHAWNICAADFRKALAAAGVKVKEVGRE